MSDSTVLADNQDVPPVQGHAIGFMETAAAGDSLAQALIQAGFPAAKINLFHGPDGIEHWEQMMKGSLWGESAEKVYHAGEADLQSGHSVIAVEVRDAIEAAKVADAAKKFGGHGFYHFGFLADTRLTP